MGEHHRWGNRPLPRDLICTIPEEHLEERRGRAHQPNRPYQVLKIDSPQGELFFWRANKEWSWYLDRTWTRRQDRRKKRQQGSKSGLVPREERHSSTAGRQAHISLGTRATRRVRRQPPTGKPRGAKDTRLGAKGTKKTTRNSLYPYPQGGEGQLGKGHPRGAPEVDPTQAPVDAWKEYNSTRGAGSDYQDRETTKGDASVWRQGAGGRAGSSSERG